MARLPYLDPASAEPRVAEALQKVPDLGIFRLVANAQGAFPAWIRFGNRLLDPDELDPLLREFAITRVGAMSPGGEYELAQHAAILLEFGGTQAQLDAIERGELDAAVLGDDGQLVVRFTTQVVRDGVPDDETFAAVSARFTPREVVHLLLVIGQYMMLARIMATAQLEPEPAVGGAALRRPGDATRARRAEP